MRLHRAILDLKNQRDSLQRYQKRIAKLTDRETAIAKECLARGQRSKALLALRRKKYQESLLAKTDLQLEQLQQLTSDVEFASVQKDVLFGLQQGTKVLKQIHAEMGGIEQVEKLLGENEEARAYQREVGEMLAGRMSNQDEDEVEDELEALQKEVQGVEEPEPQALPKVPGNDLLAFPPEEGREEKDGESEDERARVQRQNERAKLSAQEEAGRTMAEPMLA